MKPDFTQGGIPDEFLVQSIEQTTGIIIEFAQLVEVIAIFNNSDAAREIYKQFELILERYNLPRVLSGSYQDIDFDFYKFIGHELFVSIFSFLIRENRWEIIADLLEGGIYVENPSRYSREPGLVYFTYVSQPVRLLDIRKNRLNLMRISLHADILNERHIQGDLAKIVPMQQFMDADCFLFLRSEFQDNKASELHNWIPWTKVYMEQVPRYLVEASSIRNAEKLLAPLRVKNIETFRVRLKDASNKLAQMFSNAWPSSPLNGLNPLTIGSKP